MAVYDKYSKEAQEILKLVSRRFIMDGKEKKELILQWRNLADTRLTQVIKVPSSVMRQNKIMDHLIECSKKATSVL